METNINFATDTCKDKIEEFWGDEHCDSFMNNEGCAYDNGDCCQSKAEREDDWDTYCKHNPDVTT